MAYDKGSLPQRGREQNDANNFERALGYLFKLTWH